MKLLKYCNIKNIYETRSAALLGIPLLGFHLISDNDFKRKDIIRDCVRELRSFYPSTKSILVTKEKNIDTLITLVKEFEFDGVQLHYPDSDLQASALKGHFGNKFIVIQVLTPENADFQPTQCDYIIVDRSYLGGTATQVPLDRLNQLINNISNKEIKVLIAGGISPAILYQYLDLPISGFDVQSFLKSDNPGEFENTDYSKMKGLAGLLGYTATVPSSQVGFVVQDIKQENCNLYKKAIESNIDFFHIDISDGFVGIPTDFTSTTTLLKQISDLNSHINLQLHFFVSSEVEFNNILQKLFTDSEKKNISIFVHINRDNYDKFSRIFIDNKQVFFGLDVKDIIDETFPWEQFIKEQLLICLQSTEHLNRIENLNKGIKLIKYSTKIVPTITLDRSIDYDTILGFESLAKTNIVCGSYLKDDIKNRYKFIKSYLYAKKDNI